MKMSFWPLVSGPMSAIIGLYVFFFGWLFTDRSSYTNLAIAFLLIDSGITSIRLNCFIADQQDLEIIEASGASPIQAPCDCGPHAE